MKKQITILVLIIMLYSLTACAGSTATALDDGSTALTPTKESITLASDSVGSVPTTTNATTTADETNVSPEVEYDTDDLEIKLLNDADSTIIQLNGSSINVEGSGATVEGSLVTIRSAGTYKISGTLKDGQIIVDTIDEDNVFLLLAGVDITSNSSAPIFVVNAEKVILTLAAGSQNTITDGASYMNLDESGEPNAAIFSKDDLTINGDGSLNVNANFNNGIASKDDLKITGGNITVNAVNDGIKGRDSLAVKDGQITVISGADGLQSNNEEDPEKGFVVIEGGSLTILTGLDGIQAETNLLVSGGILDITTGGGSVASGNGGGGFGGRGMEGNVNQTEESVKGLKAANNLSISGGTVTISSLDDALHSNATLTINGGDLELASGDDAIHADTSLTINGGTLNITESYESLESQVITINDGMIHLRASDDGINASSGDGDMASGMRGGMGDFGTSNNYVYINGGYLYIDADGDGLDSNGNFSMTDGVVIVNGPTNNGNGPLDYMSSFNISGGFLVAVGSAGMAQAPSTDSTQYSVIQILNGMQAGGTMVHIESTTGEDILTFVPTKEYQSVLVSSVELKNGESYQVYTGGSSSGTSTDGLYTGGTYSPGNQVASFTITSIVTGQTGDMFPGVQGGDMNRPGGGTRPTRP